MLLLEPYDGAGGRVVDEILDEVHLGTADPDREDSTPFAFKDFTLLF